jgi:hypothetical protein
MAVRIRDTFGGRAAKAATAPRLAPVSDYGLGRAGAILASTANRMQDQQERSRNIADMEAKQAQREAEAEQKQAQREAENEAKNKAEQATREADTIDVMARTQGFSEAVSARAQADLDSGAAKEAGYAARFEASIEGDIAATLKAAPEELRGKLEIQLRQDRGQLVARAREASTSARVQGALDTAQGLLEGLANQTRSDPGTMAGNLAKADAAIDILTVPEAIKAKLRKETRSQIAVMALEGRIEANPGAVSRDLQAGLFDSLLGPGEKDRAIDMATARSEQLKAQAEERLRRARAEAEHRAAVARAEAAERRREAREVQVHRAQMEEIIRNRNAPFIAQAAEDNIASISQTGRPSASGATVSQVRATLGEKAGSLYQIQVGQAQRVFQATANFDRLSPQEITGRIEALRPKAGQANYSSQLEIFNGARQKGADILQQRRADPVGYWRGSTLFRDALQRYQADNPRVPKALAENEILAELQRSRGGAGDGRVRVMSKDQAARIAGLMQARSGPRGATNAVSILQQVNTSYGKYAASALADLADAGAPKGIATLAAVRPNARQTAAELMFDPTPVNVPQKDSRAIRASLNQELGGLFASYRNLPGAGERGTEIMDNAVNWVAKLEAQGLDRRSAVAQASAMFTGDYKFAEGFRFPSNIQSPRQMTVTATIMREQLLNDGGRNLAAIGGPPGQSEDARRAAYASELRRSSRWINLADDTGLGLIDGNGRPVLDRNGRPVRKTWQELRTRQGLR